MKSGENISFVVQGEVVHDLFDGEETTVRCLKSIRQHYPKSEIVLSTWQGTNVDALDFDKVVFCEDPGPLQHIGKPLNVNRQIVSSRSGIEVASGSKVVKARADIEFTDALLFSSVGKFPKRNLDHSIFSNKVVVTTATSKNPRRTYRMPYHICDWIMAGEREDILSIFQVSNYPESFMGKQWMHGILPPRGMGSALMDRRYYAESYLWSSLIRTHHPICFEHSFDASEEAIQDSEKFIVSNLIMMDPSDLGFRPMKFPAFSSFNAFAAYRTADYVQLYNRYNGSSVKNPTFLRDGYRRFRAYSRFLWGDLLNRRILPKWRRLQGIMRRL